LLENERFLFDDSLQIGVQVFKHKIDVLLDGEDVKQLL
jgi:hypothetical protein